VTREGHSTSLAARLVLQFVIGAAVIMSLAGYSLYHALRMRLEANDLAELRGKTRVVQETFAELRTPEQLPGALERLADLPAGHPRLAVGARVGSRWVLPLPPELVPKLPAAGGHHVEADVAGRSWLINAVAGPDMVGVGGVSVVLAVDTSDTRKLLQEHALTAAFVALVGTLASAVLAWFVARRGLAPLSQMAARAGQVTAHRLGDRLKLKDAPHELHGLADSINRMLERLEESFAALEQFSADIAHELRTPLNNLLLQTQVTLSRPREAAEYQETLHNNLEELERLQRMVADMLFLARAERGMIELRVEDVDLRPEVESVAEYFEAVAVEKSQRVRIAGDGRIAADRLMVRRAVTNLLSNAVRYSPAGSTIEITIACDTRECTVTVCNPGDAIPAEELRRLFSRFARRDVSRGRAVEGAGLGLAIVDSIMRLLGGSVQAASANAAVSFALRFPTRNLSNS
jgi:two-component system, OmpR family, heavy metal sensor histidine kinase CusS